MTTRYGRPIVVGVDGTDAGRTAVRWAVDEARLRAAPVRIVTAYAGAPLVDPPIGAALRRRLDDAVAYAHQRLGVDGVEGVLAPGHPSRVLVAESRAAQLVVLGRRSGGPVSALTVERVTSWVAAHAMCSVAVVRRDPAGATSGRIVVGFDGSRTGVTALDFGLEEAEASGATLDVVYCREPDSPVGGERMAPSTPADPRRRQVEWIQDAVTEVARRRAGVRTVAHLVERAPADELTERSRHAGLLVVGSRGRDAVAGRLLGSVSQELLRRSHGTVIVARRENHG